MRSGQMCPKCLGKWLAVMPEFRVPDQDTSNATEPFPPITIDPGSYARRTLGHFEIWICLGCGYTEFYAFGLEDLAELAERCPDRVRIVGAAPERQGHGQGPYR